MRNNVYTLALGFLFYSLGKPGSSSLNRTGRWNGGRDHLNTFKSQGFSDASPVLDARQILAEEMKLVEAEQSMGEDNGVLRRV